MQSKCLEQCWKHNTAAEFQFRDGSELTKTNQRARVASNVKTDA